MVAHSSVVLSVFTSGCVWYLEGSAGFGRCAALDGGIGPTLAGPRIFMGAKVKLVAYGVHLLIKYLLTKGNT